MSPVWWKTHLSGMNYVCVQMTVFITSGRYDTEVINSARIFSFFFVFFPFCVEPRA